MVALWWTVDGLISAAQVHAMRTADGGVSWPDVLVPTLASAYLWVPLTMFALWSAARLPIERGRVVAPVAAHAAAALLVSLVRAGAVVALNPLVGWYVALPPLPQLLATSLANNVIVYGLLVGVGHAVHYARTARAQQEQLARAQLLVLKSQLQPHFLFNALNTVSAYVREDPATAERIIERLGRLLRQTLASTDAQEVPLREELAALEPYLEIEEARFADRLCVRRAVEPDVLDAAVPHFVLQPLVENAIRHGIAPRAAAGTVEIAAWREGGALCLQVQDDGVGLPADFTVDRDGGVGLHNTRDRLAQLYGAPRAGDGPGASLDVGPAPGGGTRVRLRIPWRTMGREPA